MKKFKVVSLIIISMLLSLCGCQKAEEKLEAPMRIAALNGPTGMGMVQLIGEENKDYAISLYQSPDELKGKLMTGEIEIACMPSNLAAVLYQKSNKGLYLLGTNTLGTLYILQNGKLIEDIQDLKGKTIIASGKGSTPEYVLDQLLLGAGLDPEKDVTIEFLGNHTDVVTQLVATKDTIALLPQPHATIATTKNKEVKVALDLNEVWLEQEKTELPMGVIVGNKTFVDAHPKTIESFLKSYETSVKYVNEHVEEAATDMAKQGILPNESIAKAAIPYCHIVYRNGIDSKEGLEALYKILQQVNPQSIGGSLPDEGFYYNK